MSSSLVRSTNTYCYMTVDFINTLVERDLVNEFYVTMISADYLTCLGACENSEVLLSEFKRLLTESNVENKEEWEKRIDEGLEIVRRDKKKFMKK